MDNMWIEIAKTFFAGVSATASAFTSWHSYRNGKKAAEAFDESYNYHRTSEEGQLAAEQILKMVPPEVLKDLESRAARCWVGYRKTLDGGFLPDEIDEATEAVKQCVCRELRRIKSLTGTIPDRWKDQWYLYKCAM